MGPALEGIKGRADGPMVVPSSVRYPMLLLWAIHVEKHSPATGPLLFRASFAVSTLGRSAMRMHWRSCKSGICWQYTRMINLSEIVGFDWDSGNSRKNVKKHDVSQSEAEQLFFNAPLLLLFDSKHSQDAARFHALGKTDAARQLHVTFTLRRSGTLIRVISARDMHRKDRTIYEQSQESANF